MLAGCNLFPKNNANYLKENVITLEYNNGSKINITRQEFITAYNNYGSQLMNSNGYTEDQAKAATVNALINREVLLKKAKEDQEIIQKVKDKFEDLLYQTYQSLVANAEDYKSQIMKDWGEEEPDSMQEETKEGTVYTPYQKTAEVVFDESSQTYKIKKTEANQTIVKDSSVVLKTDGTVDQALTSVKDAFKAVTINNSENKYAKEGYRRYLASLRATQKNLKTNYSDEELMFNEVKRVYETYEDSEYLTEYQNKKQFNDGFSGISVMQVLNRYKAMMGESKFIYDNNLDTYKKDMLETFKNANYFINDEYFSVAHILIKFSDEQQTQFDNLKDLSANGVGGTVSSAWAEKEKQNLYNNIKGSVRDAETGEITNEDSIGVNSILSEIQTALQNASTNEQKDEAFKTLMYKYNEDDGIMNAEYAYVIGENDSKMVENFTNESRKLHERGEYGALSGLVQTEYGVHIIYYMGTCENLFTFASDGSLSLKESDILKLQSKKLNNLNNKTVFDLVYESLVQDNYSEYENVDVEYIKSSEIKKSYVAEKLI